MVIDLVHNLALLVALSMLSGFVDARWSRAKLSGQVLQGALFAAVAVISMLRPFTLQSGIIFDGRSVAVSLCAAFFGPIAATVACIPPIACRLVQGGDGAATGVIVILSSGLIGSGFWRLRAQKGLPVSVLSLWTLGLAVHVAMVLLMFTLPRGAGWGVVQAIGLPVMLIYPIATVAVGKVLHDQEQSKRLVDELRQSEARYRRIVDTAAEGICIVDTNSTITFVNSRLAQLLGCEPEDMLDRPITEFMSEGELDDHQTKMADRAERRHGSYERCFRTADGSEAWGLVSAAPMEDDAGEVIGSFAMVTDITDRKRAEEALRTSEQTYQTLLEGLPDIVMRFDRDHRHLFTSANAEDYLGIPAPDFLGRTHKELGFPEEDCERFDGWIEQAFREGEPFAVEFRLASVRGEVLIDWRLIPEFDAQGEVRTVLATARDITATRQLEQRYRRIVDTAAEGVCVLGADSTATFVNRQMAQMLGYEPEDMLGRPVTDFMMEDEVEDHMARMADRATRRHGSYERRFRAADGREVWGLVSAAPMEDDGGQVVGSFAMVTDITDRKRAEEALRLSEETYQSLLEGLPDVVMRFDREHRHTFTSTNAEDLTGIPASEFLGKTHAELGFSSEEAHQFEQWIQRVFDTGRPLETEFAFAPAAGQAMIDWRLFPEFDSQGEVHAVLTIARDVTAARQLEQRYRSVFREMPEGLAFHEVVCDADGRPVDYRFLDVNPSFERISGLRAEDVVGRTALEVLPETEPHWIETYGRVALTGDALRFEEHHGELGRYFNVLAFRPAANQFACIFSDITDRKRAEETRELALSLVEATLDATADGILAVRPDGTWSNVNQRFLSMWRLPEHITKAQDDEAALEWASSSLADPEQFLAKVRDLYEQPEATSFDTLQLADGRVFERHSQPQRLGDQAVGRVWSFRDITERVAAERALRAEKDFSDTVVASMPGLFAVLEGDTARLLHRNDRWVEVTGYSDDELSRITVLELIRSGAPRDLMAEGLREAHEQGHAAMEADILTKDGERVPFHWTCRQVRVGGMSHLVSVGLDMSERERLEGQLGQAHRMEAVGQLAGGIAHDFNNRLAVILGHTEMGLQAADLESRVRTNLSEIEKAARRSADLVSQLLGFARKQVAIREVLDLNHLIGRMLSTLERLIGPIVELRWQPGGDLWPVYMDPSQIDQVLTGLCANARDAIDGSGAITIETMNVPRDRATCHDSLGGAPRDCVRLVVSDDGRGMDEETASRIFEPFFSTKDVAEGAGLGLSTVYGIVRQNDGVIDVRTEPGRGTSFVICVPRHDVP